MWCVLIFCGCLSLGMAARPLTPVMHDAGFASYQCGRSVAYSLPRTALLLCLHHNTSEGPATTAALHRPGRVSTRLALSPGLAVQLHDLDRGGTLTLQSSQPVCYFLSRGRCRGRESGGRGGGREVRDARTTADVEGEKSAQTPSPQPALLHMALAAVTLLVLPPVAMAASLCCPAGEKRTGIQKYGSRRLSRKDRQKVLSASTNVADSDHPLGSDNYTTFHKAEEAEQPVQEVEQAGTEPDRGMGGPLSHSVPTLLEEPSPQGMRDSAHHLLESSLDVGTRSDSSQGPRYLGTSSLLSLGPRVSLLPTGASSLLSLGPRVSPEGSSLGNLSSFDKHPARFTRTPSPHHLPPGMPLPPLVFPPPSTIRHVRQHSTPVSLPPPPLLPTPNRPRPMTIIGKPTDSHRPRSPLPATPPVLPPKPRLSSPPLSPVSLSESEALSPVRPGRVRPYRVVHQPSASRSSLHLLPHSSDGVLCRECGARLSGNSATELEPLRLVASEEPGSEEALAGEPNDELCVQCHNSDPHYQELDPSDDDTLSSPPAVPPRDGNMPPIPDPVYERIGSIRRQHALTISLGTYTSISPEDTSHPSTNTFRSLPPDTPSHPPAPSPRSATRFDGADLPSAHFSPPLGGTSHFPTCPLPPRPPRLGLLETDSTESDHNYESLPSSFDPLRSPTRDTVYARIQSPEKGDADTPPFIPENSQRAHMLKIDSQGYAVVLNKEQEEGQEESHTPDPDASSSPFHLPTSASSQPSASDYEVPVLTRMAFPAIPSPLHLVPAHTDVSPSYLHTSPTHFQTSPVHTRPSPVPVPTPVPPPSAEHATPSVVPLPQPQLSPLTRQPAITSPTNTIPLPARPLQILPRAGSVSAEERRESTGSATSFHLAYRISTASSTLGESGFESIEELAEEEQAEQRQNEGRGEREGGEGENQPEGSREARGEDMGQIGRQMKIYEVENRSRTRSHTNPAQKPLPVLDMAARKLKAQTLRMHISFNEDSQTV